MEGTLSFYTGFFSQVWQRDRLIRCWQGESRTQGLNRLNPCIPVCPQHQLCVPQCYFPSLKEFVTKNRGRGEEKGKLEKNELASFNRSNTSKNWSPWESQLVWKAFSVSQKRFILSSPSGNTIICHTAFLCAQRKQKIKHFSLRVSLGETD